MPAANTNLNGKSDELTRAQKRRLASPPLGSAFDPYDRLFPSYGQGGVFDYGHAEARDLHQMLAKDGKARAIEQVLTLPLRGANHEITGPNADFVRETIPNLDLIIDQMTSAAVYRKAFFEKVWKLDGGRVVYDKLAFRPPVSCAAWYDEDNGDLKGFRQRTRINLQPKIGRNANMIYPRNHGKGRLREEPGWVYIPIEKSFIYVHGLHRDPVRGVSDMDVAYWAHETRKKVMFLWFQFLENTSLPKTVVYDETQEEANALAREFSELKSSGTMGLRRDPEGRRAFDTIDSGGAGAAQFQAAVQYLESMMTQSVLASFMDLPLSATGTGSYALSADQSEFFLTSRQAVADEMAQSINRNLIGPLIHYNYGDVELPKVEIGPLSNRMTERALGLLSAIIAAPQVNVPISFVGELVKYTASYLGLDEDEIATQMERYEEKRVRDDEEARRAQLQQMTQPRVAPGATRTEEERVQTALSAAVDAAYDLVEWSEAGGDPQDVLLALRGEK
jgi:hypothetical protein